MGPKAKKTDNDIVQLIAEIRQFAERDFTQEEKQAQLEQWSGTLMQLQKKYENTSNLELEELTRIGNHDVFRLLQMGLENKEDYSQALEAIIDDRQNSHVFSLVSFLKTPEGSRLIDKGSKGKEYSQEDIKGIQAFFGSVYGVEITQELARSVRVEMMGALLTYTASGKSEMDMRYFAGRKEELGEFLLQQALESDRECAIVAKTSHSLKYSESELTGATRGNNTTNRGRFRVDNFVLHQDQATFCNAFSDELSSLQGKSFVNYYISILRAIKNGNIPASTIHPLYLIKSPYALNQEDRTQNFSGRNLKNYVDNANLSSRQKDDISQSVFLGLMGNVEHIDELVCLFHHNPVVIGGESTDLFVLSNFISSALEKGDFKQARHLVMDKALTKMVSLAESYTKIIQSNELMEEDPSLNKKSMYVDSNKKFGTMIENFTQSLSALGQILPYVDTKEYEKTIDQLLSATKEMVSCGLKSGNKTFVSSMKKLKKEERGFALALTDLPDEEMVLSYHKLDPHLEQEFSKPQANPSSKIMNSPHSLDFQELVLGFQKAFTKLQDQHKTQTHTRASQLFLSYLNELATVKFDPSSMGPSSQRPYEGHSATQTLSALKKHLGDYGCPLMVKFVEKSGFLMQDKFANAIKDDRIPPSVRKSMQELNLFVEEMTGLRGPNQSLADVLSQSPSQKKGKKSP